MDEVSVNWITRFIVSQPPSTSLSSAPDHTPAGSDPSPSSSCLLDTFRYLHPTQEHAYTCWSTLLDCRKTNFGTRIDYILASTRLAPRVLQAEVWQHVEGSDHCPVFAELELHLTSPPASQAVPSLCSDYFSGKQSNLFSFMKARAKEEGKEDASTTEKSPVKGSKSEKSPVKGAKSPIKGAKSGKSPVKGTKRPQSFSSTRPPAKQAKSGVQLTFSSFSSTQDSKETDLAGGVSAGVAPQGGGLNETWRGIFKSRPKAKPPLCKGHSEPCVLRKVKKQGANKDREFWVCDRPVGGKKDPQARCDHFQWADKLKSGK